MTEPAGQADIYPSFTFFATGLFLCRRHTHTEAVSNDKKNRNLVPPGVKVDELPRLLT